MTDKMTVMMRNSEFPELVYGTGVLTMTPVSWEFVVVCPKCHVPHAMPLSEKMRSQMAAIQFHWKCDDHFYATKVIPVHDGAIGSLEIDFKGGYTPASRSGEN